LYFYLAANIVLFPFSYLVSSSGEGSKGPIADISIHVLLVLVHYHKCVMSDDYANNKSSTSDFLLKENSHFSENPYCKALEHAIDCECNVFFISIHVILIIKDASNFFIRPLNAVDRLDIEGNAHSAQNIKLPFALLFDTLGM